jgi:hypothetical protein
MIKKIVIPMTEIVYIADAMPSITYHMLMNSEKFPNIYGNEIKLRDFILSNYRKSEIIIPLKEDEIDISEVDLNETISRVFFELDNEVIDCGIDITTGKFFYYCETREIYSKLPSVSNLYELFVWTRESNIDLLFGSYKEYLEFALSVINKREQ